jgi:hypothetical protein
MKKSNVDSRAIANGVFRGLWGFVLSVSFLYFLIAAIDDISFRTKNQAAPLAPSPTNKPSQEPDATRLLEQDADSRPIKPLSSTGQR